MQLADRNLQFKYFGQLAEFNVSLYWKLCERVSSYVHIPVAGNKMFETSISDSYGHNGRHLKVGVVGVYGPPKDL